MKHFQCIIFISVWYNFSLFKHYLSTFKFLKLEHFDFLLNVIYFNMTNTILTWPLPILKSVPASIFDPSEMIFVLKFQNIRLPRVLDWFKKFPVNKLKSKYFHLNQNRNTYIHLKSSDFFLKSRSIINYIFCNYSR